MFENNLTNNLSKQEFSVSEVSGRIKNILEHQLGAVRVRGEISGLKIAYSGHGYFSLKEGNAVLAATCWKYNLSRINFKLEEGMEVIVTGKITAYAGQSKYQISADRIELNGVGAFMKILEERKNKLAKEGLFSAEHKQKIPFFPRKIGIITSPSGAVIKDIIHRISDRCHAHLVIWPVAVQGESSANEVAAAINGFNALKDHNGERQRPDLIIVARGGGSIEDLWSFNEEEVVRAVYNSNIPIISAIGHETDYTLIDFAADLRAPTPTAAAEFAVPVATDLIYTLDNLENRMKSRLSEMIKFYTQRLLNNQRALDQLLNITDNHTQKIDDLGFRLLSSLPNLLKQKQRMLEFFPVNRIRPNKILKYKYLEYKHMGDSLASKSKNALNQYQHKLELSASLLQSLDYNNVLKRGFAMLSNQEGKYISSISEVAKNNILSVKMQDGEIKVKRG